MKKLFMGAIALCVFAIAVCLIQISCSKTTAQNNNANNSNAPVTPNSPHNFSQSQLNKIIFSKEIATGGAEIWTANYDGTNQTQIPIILPADFLYRKQ